MLLPPSKNIRERGKTWSQRPPMLNRVGKGLSSALLQINRSQLNSFVSCLGPRGRLWSMCEMARFRQLRRVFTVLDADQVRKQDLIAEVDFSA